MRPRFSDMVYDALHDPLFPCRNCLHAWLWVLWNYRSLRRIYGDGPAGFLASRLEKRIDR